VEAEVVTLPGVVRCAAVAMPDETFGERVCVYVVLRAGMSMRWMTSGNTIRAGA
jgi:non-ribosomal peptide synthetase component E (peptide arylation enzyme)